VEVAGHGIVSHTGSAVLRLVADNTGLTAALSRTLSRRGFIPVHDRGRVLADLAVCIADGGRVLSDIAALREQGELFGPVASDTTLWHALDEIDEKTRARITGVRATVRRLVWKKITARHGGIPASRVADTDLGKTIVIRLDATIQIAHSEKEGAAGTYKGSFGHHPLGAWCDNTSENLVFRLRPGNAGANTAADNIAVCDAAIAQIPDPHRRDLLITLDGAGATRDLINHLTQLNSVHGRRVHYSAGFDLDHRVRTAISHVAAQAWQQVWEPRRPTPPPDRPRRRRRRRAHRPAAPRTRPPRPRSAAQLATRHAHHLPPRTPAPRRAAVAVRRARRLALPGVCDQHPGPPAGLPRSPPPRPRPRRGPRPLWQNHRA